eukprot:COSAG01_NODE_8831_length_2645_cov_5.119010_3_plen_97_part_00
MLRAHTRPANSANLQLLTLLGGESVHWLWLAAERALISDRGIAHVFWWSGGAQACFCTSPTACAVRQMLTLPLLFIAPGAASLPWQSMQPLSSAVR